MTVRTSPIYFALILSCWCLYSTRAFVPATPTARRHKALCSSRLSSDQGPWNGEVVSKSPGGRIQGCSIQPAKPDSVTEWELKIDGVEADLGRFSQAIYQKITRDAKQQQFQGFRPGTIPPHIEPTYRAFAMDECARETVLEAMQQNNIRPFGTTRTDMFLKDFQIPPPKQKKKKSQKKGNKQKAKDIDAATADSVVVEDEPEEDPAWLTFDTMKEAVDAGWRPGQSFSFVAVDVKGQKVKDSSETKGAKPLGLNY